MKVRTPLLGEQVLDNLSDGLLIMRLPGRTIEYVNPATERMFGYAESELVGESTEKLYVDRSHFERFLQICLPDLEQDNIYAGTFEMRRKNGDVFPTSHIVVCFSNGDGQVLVKVVLDQSEGIRQKKGMRQAERLDALGQLAGGIVHDFNNQLGVIMGHVEMIREGLLDDDPLRTDAERALTACDRAATLSKRLLGFSREQKLEPQLIDVNLLVATLVDDVLARTLGRSIDMETRLQPRLGSVFADPTELERALLNIAINACDAMPNGGSLTIATGLFRSPDHQLPEEEYVAVSFADTGTGMTTDTLEKIFEPFFSTRPEGQGTGLGLSSAYGFVRQSGGDILVKSEISKGTTFTVLLPLAQ